MPGRRTVVGAALIVTTTSFWTASSHAADPEAAIPDSDG